MPGQYFSSDSENELRLHKLGEIRWIYLSLEPSKAWPMLQEYLKNDKELVYNSVKNHGTELQFADNKFKKDKSKFSLCIAL